MPDRKRETEEELLRVDRRRRRRWRRAWAAIGLVFLLLVAVRAWWGHMADRRLQAVIDRYHAAGEPILIADFAPAKAVADSQNAALVYEEAAIAVVVPTGVEVRGEYFVDDLRFAWAYPEDSRRMVEANQPVLALLGQGDTLNECDWGVRFTSPMGNTMLPHLSWVRNLQNTLCFIAAAQHVTGDDAGALRTWSQIERVNERLVTPRENCIVQHLAALGCTGKLCRSIEAVAPALNIGNPSAASPNLKPATRERVSSLIAALLDEEPWRKGWWNAITTERAIMGDMLTLIAKGKLNASATGGPSGFSGMSSRMTHVVMGPLIVSDTAFALEFLTQLRAAGTQSTYPQAQSALPSPTSTWSTPGAGNDVSALAGLGRLMSGILMPSFDRSMVLDYRARADRRMAATALAIRLYELDHGSRPERLDELVPDYLPAMPEDPFSQPPCPIHYLPAGNPPILYSVNVDGADDGGTWEMTPLPNRRVNADRLDYPFFLDGLRPAGPLDLENGLVNPPKKAGGTTVED